MGIAHTRITQMIEDGYISNKFSEKRRLVFSRFPPDLILLDLILPKNKAWEILIEINSALK
ncbi:hypothetical protein [Microcoleus sp. D3_18a_C4]|uniref:hypothetical protein n=1 Tax=unclassified Microcoleus TaxID=2642155 RepID=UPI002FD744AD